MIATHSDYATACSARMGARLKRKQFFALQLNNLIFRGVAQLVARQFRVLEAASSSPATSTKKKEHPLRMLFLFVCSGSASCSPLRKVQNASSHIPLEDRQACLSDAERGYIRLRRKSRFTFPLLIVLGIVIFQNSLDRRACFSRRSLLHHFTFTLK